MHTIRCGNLISQGNTVCVSGFVDQGSPDLILKALSDRYEEECKQGVVGGVGDLTLLFGGGPGDWDSRCLNYLARVKCPDAQTSNSSNAVVKRAIGGHYGQVPKLGELAVNGFYISYDFIDLIAVYTFPLIVYA